MRRPMVYVCLALILFIEMFYICFPPEVPDYTSIHGREVYVEGYINSMQIKYGQNGPQFVYELDQVVLQTKTSIATKDNSGTDYVHSKIYCYSTYQIQELHMGMKVCFEGRFSSYDPNTNPGQFDSQFYYHVQDIGGCIWNATLVSYDEKYNTLQDFLQNVKELCIRKLEYYFSEKYSGVMKTILLGDKSSLDASLKVLFQEGGILHILTISGLHISMIGTGFYKLLVICKVPRKIAACIGCVFICIYGNMVGAGVATLRAICMFALQMLAKLVGRTYDTLTGVSVAAMLLLVHQPLYIYTSGFLLSFMAVLGVTVITPKIEAWGRKFSKTGRSVVGMFSGGIGILLMTFPIQLYFYFEYPLYSIWINIVILPCLSVVVAGGMLILMTPVGMEVGIHGLCMVCEWILSLYEEICIINTKLPYHNLVLGAPAIWQIIVYYIIIGFICYLLTPRKSALPQKTLCIIGLFLISFLVILWRPKEEMRIHFLDVGQGDCTLVQYGNESYLIDAGSTEHDRIAETVILPYLKYYGIGEVEGVFLSHADQDHINGILQWLSKYQESNVNIKHIILPGLKKEFLESEFKEVLRLAKEHGICVSTVSKGQRLNLGELTIEVLHPQKEAEYMEDGNGNSQVLWLEYGSMVCLFTGDIGAKEEKLLIREIEDKGEVGILKVSHHGSKYASSAEFLELIRPKISMISAGRKNSYGHPHKETIQRLKQSESRILETSKNGAVLIKIRDDICMIEQFMVE